MLNKQFKPMLCAKEIIDLDKLTYPVYCSPKRDGYRAVITPVGPRTRSLKPIGNLHVRRLLNALPVGFDGEVICLTNGQDDFRKTQSLCRRSDGEPDFYYVIFDYMRYERWTFEQRLTLLRGSLSENLPSWCKICPQVKLANSTQVLAYYRECLEAGYEGIILRTPQSLYKHGRSTLNEQYLMRMKPLESAEGIIVGVEEEMENMNDAYEDNLGHTKRASHQANKYGKGTLGALVVKASGWSDTFRIGTGFSAKERKEIWNWWKGPGHLGNKRIVTFEYDPSGGYDKPRSPRFKGFRDVADLVEIV